MAAAVTTDHHDSFPVRNDATSAKRARGTFDSTICLTRWKQSTTHRVGPTGSNHAHVPAVQSAHHGSTSDVTTDRDSTDSERGCASDAGLLNQYELEIEILRRVQNRGLTSPARLRMLVT